MGRCGGFLPTLSRPALALGNLRWLLTVLVLLLQEQAVTPIGTGIAPTRVSSLAGEITLYLKATTDAFECELFRDSGVGDEPRFEVYRGPCEVAVQVTGLQVDRHYQFQARGIDATGLAGPRSEIVNFISAGVPEWQGITPALEKVGSDNIQLLWSVPANGGSPILGYHVDMEANGDGSWERIYDGTNQPSKLTFIATGLHASLTYSFRVYAENRVGFSSYTSSSVRISDLMAASDSRPESVPTSLSADVAYTAQVRAVDPVTKQDEIVGGRRFILSVHDVCELDSTGTICVRVAPPHPNYAPDVLGQPICCTHSVDTSSGMYRFFYTLRKAGLYSLLVQAIEPGGLLGQYWDNQWLYGMPVVTRQDPDINFDWGLGAVALYASDYVSVRWTGFVLPDYSETYTFYVNADDSARLWVNGVMVFDKWDVCCQEFWGNIALTAGELASIRLEFREVAGNATLSLEWASFSTPRGFINPGKLFRGPIINGAPVLLEVATGTVNADNSVAYGEYLTAARCLESRTFYIQAKDTADNLLKSNQEVFQVTFNGPVTFTVVSAPVNPDAMDGLYQVEYLVNVAGTYRVAVSLNGRPIKDSPFDFIARPGRVSSADSTVTGLGSIEFTAGTEASFFVQARDAYSNPLDEEVGDVTASIEWEAYRTLTTMSVLDDTALNSAEFGRYFYGTSSYVSAGLYEIKYTALREGNHKLFIKINGGNVFNSPFSLRGHPASAAYGPKSLAESSKPPSTAVAGDEITFQVQLRDAYGNILASTPTNAITVRVSSPPPVTEVDDGVCTAATSGSTGLYDCRVTPTVSGDRLMSIQVGGVEISKLEMSQLLSQLNMTQGPFPLFVEPAAVSPANTAVYDVQSSYLAGVAVPALVQLRDQFGNNRTSSSPNLLFQGRFGPSTLDYTDHNNGTVTVQVGTHLAGKHPLQITLAGVQISNTPTPEIEVNSSVAKFDGTDCSTPSQIIAGIQTPYQCVPRDTFSNKVVDNDLFIKAEFINMDDSTAPVVQVDGTYSLVDDNYDFPLQINKVGAYSVVTQLSARGGLIGRYYRTPGFQSLVSLLNDRPHQGLALFEYTRVDPVLDIIWPESPVATCPEDYFSVHWHGYLLPKATGLHSIRIEADKGARVMVNSTWIIDEIDSDTAVRASAQVMLTTHVPSYIEVQYTHSAGTAYVRLYWAATEFEDELIPSEYLLHALNVLPLDTTTTVVPQEAANTSVASGAGLTSITSGQANTFVIHTRDAEDNPRSTDTTSAITGYLTSVPAVSLSFTYLGGGNYTASITPVAVGVFSMHVLVDGKDIVGSPFTTTVQPGPTSAVDSLITGTGLQYAEAGVEGVFFVTLRDAQLNHRGLSIGEQVTLDDARMSCADQGLGVYRCSYMITQAQTLNVNLRVNGESVNPVAPNTFALVINPKPIDSTSGVNYLYAFTTFFPEIRKSTDNSVTFQVRDEFGNDLPDQGNNFMFCEADGPEQRTTPFRPALDTVRTAPGLFRVNLRLDSTGVHKVNCYALNRGGINARYFNNRWVEGVPAISQVDTAIDFNWAEGLVTADSSDYASAQFDGYLQVPVAANYTFYITCDDGANLWIDDELVLSQATAGQYETRPILLTGARLYHLQVMYYERTGFARMRLEWASDQGLVRQVIGKDSWYHSRSLLGLFPQTVLVFDKPGQVEAFYHHDFEYDVNQLSWIPPQDNSAKAIVGYRIFRDNGQGGAIDSQLALTDENTFSYRDAGLVTGQVYYYRIFATNGDDGEPVTISAQPSVAPVKPDPALLVSTGSGTMTFRFTPLTGAPSGWSPTIRYTLYRNDGLGGVLRFSYEGDMDGTSTVNLVIGGLVENRQYLFQTSYWSRIGQSPLSDVTAVVCCEFRKPGSPPVNLRREGDQSNEKITLAWDAVTDIGSSSLIYYRLYMDDGYTEISKNTASGTTTTEFFEFLTPGNPYRFAVAAVNAAGEGPRSERITLTASDVAGQAYDVEATFQSSYRIDIAWKKPLLTGASGMSGYKVWVDDGNGGNIDKLIWDGGTKASTLYYSWQPVFSDGSVALLAGHTYRFQVQSVNPTGDGAKSNIFSIVAAAKPDAPGRPLVNRASTSSTAVHFSWTAPYNGGSPILGYIVERKDSPTAAWSQLTTAASAYTSTSYVDTTNIAANSFYIYRVSAFNLVTVGDTMYSPEATIPASAVPRHPP